MPTGYLVYNPHAGRYPTGMIAEKTAKILRDYGWRLMIEKARDGSHVTQLARQASEKGSDGFFIVGGDGSLNLALPGLVGTNTALGVLPAGTANVWAQEIGLPTMSLVNWSAVEESAHMLAKAGTHKVDVGFLNRKPFLLWAGAGLDAYVVHRIEPRGRWEKYFAVAQYTASAAWNAGFWRGFNLNVEIDGKDISGHYLLAVVSNIHLYAGGLAELSPDARLNDGLMDLWLFEGDDLIDTVQHAVDLLTGRHLHSDHVSRHICSRLSLETDSHLYCQVDGEPVDENNKVEIMVQKRSLLVFIPENPPHTLLVENETW
jgi:diacylglycerol kinase (ATP)